MLPPLPVQLRLTWHRKKPLHWRTCMLPKTRRRKFSRNQLPLPTAKGKSGKQDHGREIPGVQPFVLVILMD